MDDRRVWIGIAVALAVIAIVGAGGYLLGRDAGGDPAPQAASPIVIDVEDESDPATDAEAANAKGGGDREDSGGGRRAASSKAGAASPSAPAEWDAPGHEVIGVDRRVDVRRAPGGPTVRRLGHRTEFGSPRVMWVAERRGPWLGVVAPELGNGRIGWIRNEPSRLRFGTTPYTIDVDLSDRVVVLRRAGEVIRRMVVSVGRIGANTPPGRFAVTDIITRGLDAAYGCCAIALSARQPNLPAGWIGGDRIAIHGWAGSVGDAASGGCLRASNGDVRWLTRRLHLGTPVFVRA